jgi:hypothetical protein
MSELQTDRSVSRRKFLKRGLQGAVVVATGGTIAAVTTRQAFRKPASATAPKANPFAYRVDHLSHTDSQLIHYEQVASFRSPRAEPRHIAVAPDGALYLAAGNYVTVLEAEGAVRFDIALPAPARCLAIAADGELYVGLRDHIETFDPKGQHRASWDSPGPRTWFTGLAVGRSELFAADAGNRVVLRSDRSGKLLGRIGEKNKERNVPGFIVPNPFFDLELAPDGLLRVANPGRHQVEAYTTQGDFEFSWGKTSNAIDGFCGCCNPINLALLSDGRLVTCEKGLPRVKVYGADGKFESVVAGPESFAENAKVCAVDDADCTRGGLDATVDSRGRIYILDPAAGDVRIMVPKASAATPPV